MRSLSGLLLTGAIFSGAILLGATVAAPVALAGPASAADEAAYLAWVHRFADDMGVTGSDSQLLSDGYYTCHVRVLGDSPERIGISDLITTHAYTYLCPAYDR